MFTSIRRWKDFSDLLFPSNWRIQFCRFNCFKIFRDLCLGHRFHDFMHSVIGWTKYVLWVLAFWGDCITCYLYVDSFQLMVHSLYSCFFLDGHFIDCWKKNEDLTCNWVSICPPCLLDFVLHILCLWCVEPTPLESLCLPHEWRLLL